MSDLKLTVVNRKQSQLTTITLPSSSTVNDLKHAFAQQFPKWYADRQYFTIGLDKQRQVLASGTPLSNYDFSKSNNTIIFKDLGPQIAWKTVFHVEYFGPILMHALVYYFPQWFYSESVKSHNFTQQVAFACVVFHYIKREYETHFIHRFSNATMPFFNIFKNSFHYWILGGLMISFYLYHPRYTAAYSDQTVIVCAVLFLLMEFGNLYCHIILRNLRKPGSRDRAVPRGFMFEYTTCANYTFEVFAWAIFAFFTQTLTAYLFLLISTGQIAIWSVKKHVALKKEFGSAVPKRKILFPFIW